MDNRYRIALLIIAASVLAAACSSPDGETLVDTLEGLWAIETVADTEGRLVGPVEDTSPHVEFTGSKISGNTGCNSFSGSVQIRADGTFAVGDLATTLIACDPARTTQESNIHRALTEADGWAIETTTAVFSANGVAIMKISRTDNNLAGSQWSVRSINNGHGGVQSVAQGSDPTLHFGEDGYLSGTTGCNNFSAAYATYAGSLTIGPVGVTKKLCGTPSGIMDQEQQMVAALGYADSYSIAGDRLTIVDSNSATQILAVRQV